MLHRTVVLICLLVCAMNINIPLTPMVPRCMITYIGDSAQSIKFDINFPLMDNQDQGQTYQFSLFNTETKVTQYENIPNGRFKKQYFLDTNVIYRICFKAITRRTMSPLMVEYAAESQFHSQIKNANIPDNLLKNQDFKETYVILEKMSESLERYKTSFNSKKQLESDAYNTFISKNQRIITISYLEIMVIMIIGVYQFFAIRNMLVKKQYM